MATIEEQTLSMLVKALKEIRPDVDTDQGSATTDLTIKPYLKMLAPLVRSIESLHYRLSIRNAPFLADPDMDDLMANWFLFRKSGSQASGNVRLYYSNPETVVIGVGDLIVENDDGIRFSNEVPASFSEQVVRTNRENGLYYVDVPVVAQEVGNFPTPAGYITTIIADSTAANNVINKDDFYSGTNRESNVDFGIRGEQSLTMRNLVNDRSIRTVLLQEFDWLDRVTIIGYGDPEMQRDVINLEEIINLLNSSPDLNAPVTVPAIPDPDRFHVGNKTDIYLDRKNLVTAEVIMTAEETDYFTRFADINYNLDLSLLVDENGDQRFTFPILDITSVQILNTNNEPITLATDLQEETTNPTNPNGFTEGFYEWNVIDTALRFTSKEKIGLRLKSDRTAAGLTSEVTEVECVDGATIVQSSYFTINTVDPTNYYVWYNVDGLGADPSPGGSPIEVLINGADSANTVATKTANAITAINGGLDFSATSTLEIASIQNVNAGEVVNATAGNSGLAVKVITEGSEEFIAGKTTLQGVPLKITYRYFEGIVEVQEFVENLDRKLVGSDPLAKAKLPGIIDYFDDRDVNNPLTTLKVRLQEGVTTDDVEQAITDFIENVSGSLEISDLVGYLYNLSLVTYVQLPTYLRLTVENEDRSTEVYKATNTGGEGYLDKFDLEELEKRNVGFISEVVVEAVE